MSISSSLRLFPPKTLIPLHPKTLIPKTPVTAPPIRSKLSFFSSISIERLPTRASSSSSSTSSSPTSSLQSIEDLPPKLQEIVNLFQSVPESKAKYEQLLYYGRKLAPLDSKFKTKENKVEGCVSQVWVRAYLDSEKNVRFEADSDSVLTKGLAALLVQGLSGRPVSEIVKISPEFVTLLGLQQSLTPSRNNGFLNMFKLMQLKALQVSMEAEEGVGSVKEEAFEAESKIGNGKVDESAISEMRMDNSSSGKTVIEEKKSNLGVGLGSRGERIKEMLERELSPVDLEVEDISYQHAGHAGVRGSDGETHFNVRIVSKEFEGKSMVKRHRLVYDLLKEELQSGLHALSIVAKTPSEFSGKK